MPKLKRHSTKYQGVYFINGTHPATGKPERIYYARYRRQGKAIDEKIGAQFRDDMTPAKAARIRAARVDGKQESNTQRREAKRAENEARANRGTISRLWESYKKANPDLKGLPMDESRFRKHLEEPFGKLEPLEIKKSDTDDLRIELLKAGKKPQTVKNILELLRRLINHGAQHGDCAPLPFKITMPRVSNERKEFLTPEEIQRLFKVLDTWPDAHMAAAVKMALFCGMRRGEILALEWPDVDFRSGTITIRNPKSGFDQQIPLNKKTRELLKDFPRSKGKIIFKPKRDVSVQARDIRQAAELPPDHRLFHGARHTYASLLVTAGVSLFTVSKLLTHTSIKQTQRYAHLAPSAERAASDRIGDLLESGDKSKGHES